MATSFAALETLVNGAVIGALANASMTWGVSFSADGVFSNEASVVLGMADSSPTFTALTSAVGAIAYGTAVVIGGVSYTVVSNAPDATGMSVLTLQKT